MHWFFLALAIIFEASGTTAMKLSHGMTRLLPTIAMFGLYAASLSTLSLALKRIELTVAYAIWCGLGTVLIAIAAIYFFGEKFTAIKVVSIVLVIAGVFGLNLSSSNGPH